MVSNGGFGSFRHLAGRFFGALDRRGPSPSEEAWALGWLLPGEQRLWRRMSGPDRRHAAGVARDAASLLGWGGVGPGSGGGCGGGGGSGDARGSREVVASALLHDVGKVESGIGTFGRVAVTLAAIVLGRQRLALEPGRATQAPRWRRRISDYLAHDRIGASLLEEAGSHPVTIAWAREHHLPSEAWTVERRVAEALKAADGD